MTAGWLAGLVCLAAADSEPPATFHRDIAPIIENNCISCHRPGHIAPFSLLTHADVSKRAAQIAKVTADHFMPPWLPEPAADGVAAFVGERRLTRAQIALIQRWVSEGSPEGDPNDSPPVPQASNSSVAPRGEPDLVLQMPEPFTIPAEDTGITQSFVFPIDLPEDQNVVAIELVTADPRLVHHAAFLIDTTGNARMLDQADPGPGYASMGDIGLNLAGSFGLWSPADGARPLPTGVGRPLPQRCDLVAEMHLNPTGKPETLQASIGLYFAHEPVRKVLTTATVGAFHLDIPPGKNDFTISDTFTIPVDAQLISLTPHAHYVCQRMTVGAVLPDGKSLSLLRINDWDFNWQQEYRFAQPVPLPGGTRIEMKYIYDNSAENPQNPSNPPRRVVSGYRIGDEMGLLFLNMIAENSPELPKLQQGIHDKLIELLQQAQRSRTGR